MPYAKHFINVSGRQLTEILDLVKLALTDFHRNNYTHCYSVDNTPMILKVIDGIGKLEPMTIERIQEELSYAADFFFNDGRGKQKALNEPPIFLAKQILDQPNKYLKELKGIIYSPVIFNSLRFSDSPQWAYEPRYSGESGLYRVMSMGTESLLTVAGNIEDQLPDNLEHLEIMARQAIDYLFNEVLIDFAFATPADRANALIAILHFMLCNYIKAPTPIYMIEAACANSGKSTLAKVISIIANGFESNMITVEDDTSNSEFSKLITSKLREKPSIFILDNVNFEIKSARLCSIVSEGKSSDRVLGMSKMVDIDCKGCQFIITANSPQMTYEVARRSIRIRLALSAVGREFKHNIIEYVKDNRPKILQALVYIIQLWLLKESKPGSKKLNSFERWSSVMSGILEANSVAGFLDNLRETQAAYDKTETELASLFDSWFNNNETPRAASPGSLYGLARKKSYLLDKLTSPSDPGRLSQFVKILRKYLDRPLGGYIVKAQINANTHNNEYIIESVDPNKKPRLADVIDLASHHSSDRA
jgi:hypothetical protein